MAAIQVGSYSITNSGLFLTAFENPTVTTDPFTWFLERVSSPQASPPVYRIKAGQPAGDSVITVEVSLEAVFEPAPDGAQPEKGSVLTIIGDSTAGWSITPDALRRGSIVTVSEFPEGVKFPDGVSVYLVQESGKVGWVAADNTVVGQVPEGAVWKFQRTDREFPGVGQAFKITKTADNNAVGQVPEGAIWMFDRADK